MSRKKSDVSRRDFLKTAGVGSLAGAIAERSAFAEADQAAEAFGPDAVPITLTINGRRHQLNVEPRVTLLDAMRTRLDISSSSRIWSSGRPFV